MKKYGSGFIRIRKELETYPEIFFSVEEIGGGVLVTFRMREGVNEGANEGVNRLYQCIKINRIDELQRDDCVSSLRNRLLAEAFYLTGDNERYGTGFVRIREHLCNESGSGLNS